MAERWVKLYEKLEHSSIYRDSEMVHLWVHLLIKATRFPYKIIWGGNEIDLKPGELVTGRKQLSAKLRISESKIQRILKVFETCHMIEQRTNHQSRIISILNWERYQESEQQMNNVRTTVEQRLNTNKKEERKNNTIAKPDCVSEQTWIDFLAHRKAKKAPITDTALKVIMREASKAGLSTEDALSELISRGWTGFKADWVSKQQKKSIMS